VPAVSAPPERLLGRDLQRVFERYHRSRDPRDQAALAERFLPLARHLARRYFAPTDADDLDQVASLGLLKAIERYDPGRGIAFTTYAVPTITGELRRYFRDFGWSVRVPRSLQELSARVDAVVEELSGELGRTPTTHEIAARCEEPCERILEALSTRTAHRPDSLDRPLGDDERTAPVGSDERGFAEVERSAEVDRLLARLPERTATIMRLRFVEDLTQREIATRVDLSQMQVSREIRDALHALRKAADAQAAWLAIRNAPRERRAL
jgi:RNA polymerase sigma-B factor